MMDPLAKALPAFIRSRIRGRRTIHQVLGNIGWLVLDKALRIGCGIFVGVWVARYLGSDRFGALNYATALAMIFSPFATLGLDAIVVRNLVQGNDQNETLGTAFALKLIGSLLVLVFSLTTGCLFLRTDTATRLMIGVIAAGTIFQSFDVIDFWFQSQVRSKYVVYSRNAAFLLVSALKVILIKSHASMIAFAWAGVGELLLASVGLVTLYRITAGTLFAWRIKLKCAVRLLSDSWPLMLSGIVIFIYMRLDQVMLGEMKNNHEVGIYSAAVRLSELWFFIPTAIGSSVLPSILKTKGVNTDLYSRRIQKLLTLMALLGYAVALPMSFLSNHVMHIVFGGQFDGGGPSLAVLCWAGLFVSIGVASGPWLIAGDMMRFSLIVTALGALINVLVNLALIPPYGALGAAIASLVSYAVAAFLGFFIPPRTRELAFMMLNAFLLRYNYTFDSGTQITRQPGD